MHHFNNQQCALVADHCHCSECRQSLDQFKCFSLQVRKFSAQHHPLVVNMYKRGINGSAACLLVKDATRIWDFFPGLIKSMFNLSELYTYWHSVSVLYPWMSRSADITKMVQSRNCPIHLMRGATKLSKEWNYFLGMGGGWGVGVGFRHKGLIYTWSPHLSVTPLAVTSQSKRAPTVELREVFILSSSFLWAWNGSRAAVTRQTLLGWQRIFRWKDVRLHRFVQRLLSGGQKQGEIKGQERISTGGRNAHVCTFAHATY